MNAGDRAGIEALRASIETVASDLDRLRGASSRGALRRRRRPGLLAAAVLAGAALGIWFLYPGRAPEVKILELRIHGRSVPGVVVDAKNADTFVVMPQRRGSPLAAVVPTGERP